MSSELLLGSVSYCRWCFDELSWKDAIAHYKKCPEPTLEFTSYKDLEDTYTIAPNNLLPHAVDSGVYPISADKFMSWEKHKGWYLWDSVFWLPTWAQVVISSELSILVAKDLLRKSMSGIETKKALSTIALLYQDNPFLLRDVLLKYWMSRHEGWSNI